MASAITFGAIDSICSTVFKYGDTAGKGFNDFKCAFKAVSSYRSAGTPTTGPNPGDQHTLSTCMIGRQLQGRTHAFGDDSPHL